MMRIWRLIHALSEIKFDDEVSVAKLKIWHE